MSLRDNEPLRGLIASNGPHANTGYGTQTRQICRRLRDGLGHKIAVFAFYGLAGSSVTWEGFKLYPAALDSAGSEMVHGHADNWKADYVLFIYDPFAVNPNILRQMSQHVMFWHPIDCEPMSRADVEALTLSGAQSIAMSRFGERMLQDEGFDPLYVPHGIETRDTFLPPEQLLHKGAVGPPLLLREAARKELREELKIPADAFVAGMNVHNKDADRKAIFEQMAAFSLLSKQHRDAVLLCHTVPHPVMSHADLLAMAEYLGIAHVCFWADPYSYLSGDYTQDDMARWYGRQDVYLGASRGEGFGLPLIEAQACGVPVITTDASAMTELAGPGWLVSGQPYWQRGHKATWTTPDIGELTDALREAYDGEAWRRSAAARSFAEQYDADLLLETMWRPLFTKLEDQLRAGVEADGSKDAGWKRIR